MHLLSYLSYYHMLVLLSFLCQKMISRFVVVLCLLARAAPPAVWPIVCS